MIFLVAKDWEEEDSTKESDERRVAREEEKISPQR